MADGAMREMGRLAGIDPEAESGPETLRAALETEHAGAWRWALRCCDGDKETARDLLHDVYVAVLDGRARFLRQSSFRTWLYGVIRMSARAARRKRLVLNILFEPLKDDNLFAAAPHKPATILEPPVRRALAQLPRRQREVIVLVFEHDLTLEDAAAAMGVSLGAVRTHYARAKDKLRVALAITDERHE